MKSTLITMLKRISIIYICMALLSFPVSILLQLPSKREVWPLQHGCYWTNALIGYIECKGLFINGIIEFPLNLWMQIIYAPMFAVGGLMSGSAIIVFLTTITFIALYFPLFYLIWYWFKGRHIIKHT